MSIKAAITEYELLVDQLEKKIASDSITNETQKLLQERIYNLLGLIEKEDNSFLYGALKKHTKKKELNSLCLLIEFVRSEGILYKYYTKHHSSFIETALSIAIQIINNTNDSEKDAVFCFVNQLYDVIFHQVRFEEYDVECSYLYYDLSLKLLDPKFFKFLNRNQGRPNYEGCIYFIEMAFGWFVERKEEFLVLKQKVIIFNKQNTGNSYFLDDWIPYNTMNEFLSAKWNNNLQTEN